MAFEQFLSEYGTPQPRTGAELAQLGLEQSKGVVDFVSAVGGGIFDNGLISIASVREAIPGLGGWERWLPPGSRLFGCSVFGVLLTTVRDDLWLVETQYGQVVESDFTFSKFIDTLAEPATRDEILQAPLFRAWHELGGRLEPTQVLCPTPAPALGGSWAIESLSPMSLPVYLSFTAQLFDAEGDGQVEVRRRAT
jgi:hypothetical protein